MKQLLFLLITFMPLCAFSQSLLVYEDTVNHFTVGVPSGWRYGMPKDKSTTFIATRRPKDSTDIVRERFSINVLYGMPSDFNTSYKEFLSHISKAPGFRILEEGEKEINKRQYKWLIETHKYNPGNEDAINYVYFANSGKSLLILTMVSSAQAFPEYRDLFDKIASSLKY